MARHKGGTAGKAGKVLQSNTSTKKQKSDAGKKLVKHKNDKH